MYFCVWHALRHIVRLLAVDPTAAAALESRRYGAAISAFVRDAAPLTAVSLGLLGSLYLVVPGTVTDPLALVGTYLVLIAVLTLPHVVVVTVMDYEQRIWTPA
nr:Brp/Blh family beta-carotene 15,15'-dioxygenase [Natronomonas sp. LN261]